MLSIPTSIGCLATVLEIIARWTGQIWCGLFMR